MTLGVGDIVRTTVNFTLGSGDQFQNVYHHIFDGIGGVSDAAVVADIETWVETVYATLNNYVRTAVDEQLCSVDQVEWVVDAWEIVANIGTFLPTIAQAGTSESLPNQIAPFVTFKTARPKSVGRKFMFPPGETDQAAGIINSGTVAAYVAYAGEVLTDIVVDIVNELHPGIVRTGVNDFLVFTLAVVTDLVGTQRRRRPGYGA